MIGVLGILFIVVPIVEIYVIMAVGGAIGGFATLCVIVVMAFAGAALARVQGTAALREIQRAFQTGQAIGRTVVSGLLVLVSAVLMITPGFVTDAVGLLLLVPPIRAAIATVIIAFAMKRGIVFITGAQPFGGQGQSDGHDPPPSGVIDV